MGTRLLTIKEVAAELQCSESAVRAAYRKGLIKVLVFGHRTVRVTKEELERFKAAAIRE